MARSEQEEVVREISSVIFGGMELMNPDLYRQPPKEPADLAWVLDGCAFLINMTSGKKSFEQKRSHNHKQLHTWLHRWSRGEVLRGETIRGRQNISYDDVDYIIGISVVGGADVGSSFDRMDADIARKKVASNSDKIVCFVTISENILKLFAESRFLARDLIAFIRFLSDSGGKVDDQIAQAKTVNYLKECSRYLVGLFSAIAIDYAILDKSHNRITASAIGISNDKKYKEVSPFFCDLKMIDLLWIATARKALLSTVGVMNGITRTIYEAEWASGTHRLVCMVILRTDYGLKLFTDDALKSRKHNATYIQYMDFGKEAPITMWAIDPILPKKTVLRQEVSELVNI